jgi:adenylate kinase
VKRRIVLLGPPASGKGTQASLIEEHFGIPVTSPGAILREEKKNGTKLGIEAEEYTKYGKLLPDELIIGLVQAWLNQHDGQFVFDGFPRSIGQADALVEMLAKRNTPLDVVLALSADDQTLHQRVASRVMCSKCGRIFSIGLHVGSLSDACPVCGGVLTRRTDDTPETLNARLVEYHEKTEPLLAYYSKAGLLKTVDSTRAPEVVFESVRQILEEE